MGLTPDAKRLAESIVEDSIAKLGDLVIELVDAVSDNWALLSEILFGWKMGGVFDDTRPPTYDLPTEYQSWRILTDYNLVGPGYDFTHLYEDGQTTIPASSIGRNAMLFGIIAILAPAFAALGIRKAGSIFSYILGSITGIKPRLNKLQDGIDELLELSRSVPVDTEVVEDDIVVDKLDFIISVLNDADTEMSALIDALARDRLSRLVSVDWGDDGYNPPSA